MIKEDLQRWHTSFCHRFPRMAKFMGLMHRRHRPIRALFMVFAHTLGFFFFIQAVMQTRTEQGAVAWVFALNTVPVAALPAWFVFCTNDVKDDQNAKRLAMIDVQTLSERLIKNVRPVEVPSDRC